MVLRALDYLMFLVPLGMSTALILPAINGLLMAGQKKLEKSRVSNFCGKKKKIVVMLLTVMLSTSL